MKNPTKLSNIVGWIAAGVYLAVVIYITVEIMATGRDPAILFLLWIIFVGLIALLAGRTIHGK